MGQLLAKVNGQWINVAGSPDEVFVGPEDPGSAYDLWYDTDDFGSTNEELRWYSSWGIVQLGGFNIANGTTVSATGSTLVASVGSFTYLSGRRYRVFFEVNAVTAGADASGYWQIGFDSGAAQAGAPWFQVWAGNGYQSFSYEFFLEKYGLTAGPHTVQIYWGANVGAITIHNDLGSIEVRDMGSTRAPTVFTPPTPWTALPFAAGWKNYQGGGTIYGNCQYRRVGDMVYLRGLAESDSGLGTITTVIGTLPVGMRPAYVPILNQECSMGTGSIRVDLLQNGNINIGGAAPATASWVSLAGMWCGTGTT